MAQIYKFWYQTQNDFIAVTEIWLHDGVYASSVILISTTKFKGTTEIKLQREEAGEKEF